MSRPEKPIDWDLVDQLLMANCHGTEIAPHFDMHYNTFYDKVIKQFGIGFTEYSAQKKAQGDSCLRAKQYQKAISENGDTTMLIWLGKCRLLQKEHEDKKDTPPNDANLTLVIDLMKENQKLKERLDAIESKAIPVVQPSQQEIQPVDRSCPVREDILQHPEAN